jgi:UDP-GlcNAc3NAcA epimerase
MKILQIIGARPQYMKYFPVARAIEGKNGISDVLVDTGQHYDYTMSKIFFDEMGIKEPNYHLEVGSGSHGKQTAQCVERIEKILNDVEPDIVVVYGDTNSTLAGAIAASKLLLPVVHIEAGLRSFNKYMPEELNRILSDHVSSMLFCPSTTAIKNLVREGFTNIINNGMPVSTEDIKHISFPHKIDINNPIVINSGDVMHDTLLYSREMARMKSEILSTLGIQSKKYIVLTLHRAENTDDTTQLNTLINFINSSINDETVIFPMHPRTRKVYGDMSQPLAKNVKIIDPVGYFDLIALLGNARLLMTDSGGMQKEAYWLGIPCVTLRDETEWIETVEAGWNILYKAYKGKHNPTATQTDLYGDGRAAEVIVEFLVKFLKR